LGYSRGTARGTVGDTVGGTREALGGALKGSSQASAAVPSPPLGGGVASAGTSVGAGEAAVGAPEPRHPLNPCIPVSTHEYRVSARRVPYEYRAQGDRAQSDNMAQIGSVE
jgi:hypothetical protein